MFVITNALIIKAIQKYIYTFINKLILTLKFVIK